MAPSAPSNAAPSVLGKGDVSEISGTPCHVAFCGLAAERPHSGVLAGDRDPQDLEMQPLTG